MQDTLSGILIFFLVMNVAAFLAMFVDKIQARKNRAERISEGMLFFLATVFGSVGVYAGMFAFRHKTRKWHFIFGIPLLMLQNTATLYVAHVYLSGKI